MADVVITLSLSRRSGILAAAVSAVSRAGLNFGTHRFEDAGEGPRLQLNAESDGEFANSGPMVAELSTIRGIDEVMDVQVDGRSLLHPEEEPPVEPPAADDAAEAAPEPVAEAGPAGVFSAEPVDGDEPLPPAARADLDPKPEPEPEPEPEFFTIESLTMPETPPADDGARSPEPAPASARPAARPVPDEDVMMRRSMVRRRRRRR